MSSPIHILNGRLPSVHRHISPVTVTVSRAVTLQFLTWPAHLSFPWAMASVALKISDSPSAQPVHMLLFLGLRAHTSSNAISTRPTSSPSLRHTCLTCLQHFMCLALSPATTIIALIRPFQRPPPLERSKRMSLQSLHKSPSQYLLTCRIQRITKLSVPLLPHVKPIHSQPQSLF